MARRVTKSGTTPGGRKYWTVKEGKTKITQVENSPRTAFNKMTKVDSGGNKTVDLKLTRRPNKGAGLSSFKSVDKGPTKKAKK